MAHYCYQGLPTNQPPSPTVTVESGGSVTSAKTGNYYFWLQLRNLAGYGLPSVSTGAVAIAAGQKFKIVIPNTALPSPNGCYIWGYYILASRTNDISQASVVCSQPGYDIDGSTIIPPPQTIYLAYDEHLEISKTVLTTGALPTGSNRVHGMRRYLDPVDPDEVAEMLEWDSRDNQWKVIGEGFNTSVSDIKGTFGALRDLALIDPNTVLFPTWGIDPTVPHRPVRYWLINDTTQVIPSGTNIAMRVKNGIYDLSTSGGIVGGIELRFLGYATITTGVLDTTDMTVNTPVTYDGPLTPFTLQKDLDPGEAFVLQVQCKFSKFELSRRPGQNTFLEFQPEFTVDRAVYNPVDVFGSYIAPRFKYRRIVPETGLSALALKGSGAISLAEGGSMLFNSVPAQVVPGLQPNTDNQNCLISVDGTCYISTVVPDSGAEIRAKIGTTDGIGNATDWHSTTVPLNGTVLLKVAVTHPTAIRANYPDSAIVGSSDGEFNGVKVVVYVRPDGGGTINRFEATLTPGAASEDITVGASSGTAVGTSLPAAPSSAFGLFEYSTSSFTPDIVAGTSVFSAGTYQVAIAVKYENTVTSISHSVLDGCIPEITSSLADAVSSITDAAASGSGIVFNDSAAPSTNAAQSAIYSASGKLSIVGYSNTTKGAIATVGAQQSYSKSQSVTPATLTDASSIAIDASLSNVFRVTLGGNRALANPTNLSDGQTIVIMVKQDATGSRTLSYGSAYKWAGGSAPTLSTAANARDIITCVYDDASSILLCAINKNFA